MTGSAVAVETIGLSKTLDGRGVLREIDLEICVGECVALTGGNGAGKSTLLRCLAGLMRPTSGSVRWFGRVAGATARDRRWIGLVADQDGLYNHLTLRENLLFAARMASINAPAARTEEALERIGMQAMANRRVHQLSKGMRQRLALARALIHEPIIILLDEPFCGLDEAGCRWLGSLLRQRRADGNAVCLTTHNAARCEGIADRVVNLCGGKLDEISPSRQPSRAASRRCAA